MITKTTLAYPLLLWSSLLSAEQAAPMPWRVHDALSLPPWLQLSFEHRTRYESVDNQFRALGTGGDQVIAFRTLALLEATFASWRVGGEFIDSRLALDDSGTPIDTTQVDGAELLQAYAAWNTKTLLGSDLSAEFKGGRQTIDLGSRRLVARNSFRNTINSFTGLHFMTEVPGQWQARSFFVLPVTRLPDTVSEIVNDEVEFDEESFNAYFGALFLRRDQIISDTNGEIYFLALNEEDGSDLATRDRELYTPGFRIFKDPAKGQVDFELESVYQFGQSRASTQVTDTKDLDHFAHMHHGQIGYTFALPWSPRFLAQYDYASGDEDPTDDRNGRFDTLFGARRFEFGPTGIWGAFARSNISSPGYRLIVKPHETVSAFIAHRLFWLAQSKDAWTTANIRDVTGQSGDFIGHQIEASVNWQVIPKNITLEAGWAHLVKGEFAENAPNAPVDTDDSDYFYAQTVLQF